MSMPADPARLRRLVERLRRHPVGEPLRDLLLTAAATIEHQADVIAATRCDCAALDPPADAIAEHRARLHRLFGTPSEETSDAPEQ